MWFTAINYEQSTLISGSLLLTIRNTNILAQKKKKQKRKSRKKQPFQWKKWLTVTAIAFVGILIIFLASVYLGAFGKLPNKQELLEIQHPLASEIYGSDGTLLGKYFLENRTHVEFEELPQFLVDALVATEDARFYKHSGLDIRSLGRVFFKSILMMDRSSGGGSTISQQLAKNLYPRQRFWIFSMPVNKVKEIIIAKRIEKAYSKKDILALYLNTVPFGENVFGIGVASERFFSKMPFDLLPEEGATLVGMLKATTFYSPRRNPERAEARRNTVFEQMYRYKYITADQKEFLQEKPLVLNYSRKTDTEGLAMYFREYLKKEIRNWCKDKIGPNGEPYNLHTDGLRIYTSIDPTLQMYAEQSVKQVVAELQEKFDKQLANWKPYYLPLEEATKRSERYRALQKSGLDYKAIQTNFATEIPMRIYTPEGPMNVNMSPIDSIKHYLKFLQGAFFAMDPGTGEVKAWVGGIDHHQFGIDYVTTPRQVGSTFKPFVYAAAMEQGISACTYYDNERITYEDYKDWSPRNSNNEYGGSYTLAGALQNSVNTVSVQVLFDAGIENTIDLAHDFGIESEIPELPSIALGTAELNLMEMVTSYAPFANEGFATKPVYLYRIEDQNGNILEEFNESGIQSSEQVFPDSLNEEMVNMLQNVIDHGTGRRLRTQYGLAFDIAGKTGTTQNQSDGWFIGFTPNLIGGAWVGANDRRMHFQTLSDGQGARTALPIWAAFFSKVEKDRKFRSIVDGRFKERSVLAANQPDCEPYSEHPAEYMNQQMWEKENDDILIFRDINSKASKDKGLKSILETIFGKKDKKLKKTRKQRRADRRKKKG